MYDGGASIWYVGVRHTPNIIAWGFENTLDSKMGAEKRAHTQMLYIKYVKEFTSSMQTSFSL